MTIINKLNIEVLYEKAKTGYYACINNVENIHLQSEVLFPLNQLILKELTVKVVYSKLDLKHYQIEVELEIRSTSDELVGKYIYILNETDNQIDDYLIFF